MIASWRLDDKTTRSDAIQSEVRFEKQRLWMLLRALRLTKRADELWNDFEDYYGLRQLSFESFDRIYPTFPWQLATKCEWRYRWMADRGYGLVFWFRDFGKTPIWEWYLNRRRVFDHECHGRVFGADRVLDEHKRRPFGLIFRSFNTKGGFIVHNAEPQSDPHHRFEAPDYDGRPGRFCIEFYRNFLKAVVRSNWSPKRDDWSPPTLAETSYVCGSLIEPWMVQLLNAGSACVVFGFLVRILYWNSDDKRLDKHLGRRDGEKCLRADTKCLAEWTGVSERQARSAMTRLRSRNFIVKSGNTIVLNRAAINAELRTRFSSKK